MQAQSNTRMVDGRPAAAAALAASLVFAAGIALGAVAGIAARPGVAPVAKTDSVPTYIQHRNAEMGAPAAITTVLGPSWYAQHRDAETAVGAPKSLICTATVARGVTVNVTCPGAAATQVGTAGMGGLNSPFPRVLDKDLGKLLSAEQLRAQYIRDARRHRSTVLPIRVDNGFSATHPAAR